ncbi:MAG: NAD-dependent epimerase/dehydratase family protein [Gammaproteobacteria bacterium]
MRIFVTGSDGYIGTLLAPMLINRGHEVIGLDAGFFRRGWLYSDRTTLNVSPRTISKDLRQVDAFDLAECAAVIHLAELSNDPLGELRPEVTMAINHLGSVEFARTAKRAGVSRFVYSSSCSVYGAGRDAVLSETSDTQPQTTYARCKVLVEAQVAAMADARFSPVFLRNATAYGASPRMRFDLVVNNLAGLARVTGKIAMTSDGTPWRPLVHVQDICRAMVSAVEAPKDAIHGQVFNIGSNEQNFQVREVAALVGEAFPDCAITLGSRGGDARSYKVSFDKAHNQLAGFRCEWDPRRGVGQLRSLFDQINLKREQFEFPAFTRLEELKYLLDTHQLDDALFWRC